MLDRPGGNTEEPSVEVVSHQASLLFLSLDYPCSVPPPWPPWPESLWAHLDFCDRFLSGLPVSPSHHVEEGPIPLPRMMREAAVGQVDPGWQESPGRGIVWKRQKHEGCQAC